MIPKFTVAGKESGETIPRAKAQAPELHAKLEWTFPLAFVEIVTGDE